MNTGRSKFVAFIKKPEKQPAFQSLFGPKTSPILYKARKVEEGDDHEDY